MKKEMKSFCKNLDDYFAFFFQVALIFFFWFLFCRTDGEVQKMKKRRRKGGRKERKKIHCQWHLVENHCVFNSFFMLNFQLRVRNSRVLLFSPIFPFLLLAFSRCEKLFSTSNLKVFGFWGTVREAKERRKRNSLFMQVTVENFSNLRTYTQTHAHTVHIHIQYAHIYLLYADTVRTYTHSCGLKPAPPSNFYKHYVAVQSAFRGKNSTCDIIFQQTY